MKIEINKNQQRTNYEDHVSSVIRTAKTIADLGQSKFEYFKPKDTGRRWEDLVESVKETTEGTVIMRLDRPLNWSNEKIYFEIK